MTLLIVKDNSGCFEWDSNEGDIYQMILWIIRLYMLDDLENYCITDKE